MDKKIIYGLLVFGVILYCGYNITMEEEEETTKKQAKGSSKYKIPPQFKQIADKPLFTAEDKELQNFVKKYPKISNQMVKYLVTKKAKTFFPWYIKGKNMKYETRVTEENLKKIAFWSAMGRAFGFKIKIYNGYIFFKYSEASKTYQRSKVYLPQIIKDLDNKTEKLQELVQQYKVHLMPENITSTLYTLLQLFTSKKYKKLIHEFKLHFYQNDEAPFRKVVYPRLVIYPFSSTKKTKIIGKKTTQSLITMLYNDLSKISGTGKTPRFNQKTTDLIFVAQGDGSHKIDKLEKYFEPERVYYASWFNKKGGNQDYKIKNPKDSKRWWKR